MRVIINDKISLPIASMENGLATPKGYAETEATLSQSLNMTFPYSKAIFNTLIELLENKTLITNLEFQNDIEDIIFIINDKVFKLIQVQHYLDNRIDSIFAKLIEEEIINAEAENSIGELESE